MVLWYNFQCFVKQSWDGHFVMFYTILKFFRHCFMAVGRGSTIITGCGFSERKNQAAELNFLGKLKSTRSWTIKRNEKIGQDLEIHHLDEIFKAYRKR